MISYHRINNKIKANKVRLMDFNGEQLGILNINIALKIANNKDLDLVEINPNSDPPACKIMNYGKFLYKKNKSEKKQNNRNKIIQIKEIKLRLTIDKNDYQVKFKKIIGFLKKGNKVKIIIIFRGREINNYYNGFLMLEKIKNRLENYSLVEFLSKKIENRQIIMILSSKKR